MFGRDALVQAIKPDEQDHCSISNQNMRTYMDNKFNKKFIVHLPDIKDAFRYWTNFIDSLDFDIEL